MKGDGHTAIYRGLKIPGMTFGLDEHPHIRGCAVIVAHHSFSGAQRIDADYTMYNFRLTGQITQ